MQAAWSSEVRPGGDDVCVPGVDCLTVQGISGTTNDKRALLMLSGNVDLLPTNTNLIDGGGAPNFFSDDLGQIFEDENVDLDLVFDNRPTTNPANDILMVLE